MTTQNSSATTSKTRTDGSATKEDDHYARFEQAKTRLEQAKAQAKRALQQGRIAQAQVRHFQEKGAVIGASIEQQQQAKEELKQAKVTAKQALKQWEQAEYNMAVIAVQLVPEGLPPSLGQLTTFPTSARSRTRRGQSTIPRNVRAIEAHNNDSNPVQQVPRRQQHLAQQRPMHSPPQPTVARHPNQSQSRKQPSRGKPRILIYQGPPDEDLSEFGGWPPGWTKKVFERQVNKIKDKYWYSPEGKCIDSWVKLRDHFLNKWKPINSNSGACRTVPRSNRDHHPLPQQQQLPNSQVKKAKIGDTVIAHEQEQGCPSAQQNIRRPDDKNLIDKTTTTEFNQLAEKELIDLTDTSPTQPRTQQKEFSVRKETEQETLARDKPPSAEPFAERASTRDNSNIEQDSYLQSDGNNNIKDGSTVSYDEIHKQGIWVRIGSVLFQHFMRGQLEVDLALVAEEARYTQVSGVFKHAIAILMEQGLVEAPCPFTIKLTDKGLQSAARMKGLSRGRARTETPPSARNVSSPMPKSNPTYLYCGCSIEDTLTEASLGKERDKWRSEDRIIVDRVRAILLNSCMQGQPEVDLIKVAHAAGYRQVSGFLKKAIESLILNQLLEQTDFGIRLTDEGLESAAMLEGLTTGQFASMLRRIWAQHHPRNLES